MNNSRSTKISVGMFYQIQSDIYYQFILALSGRGHMRPHILPSNGFARSSWSSYFFRKYVEFILQ